MTLRTEAGESVIGRARDRLREATGSPGVRELSTIWRKISRERSFRAASAPPYAEVRGEELGLDMGTDSFGRGTQGRRNGGGQPAGAVRRMMWGRARPRNRAGAGRRSGRAHVPCAIGGGT